NHLDPTGRAAESRERLCLEKPRHGGEPVRLLDVELGDWTERRVLSDDGDVRTVERRHDANVGARRTEHLLGDPRARRVWNRVVTMQQVEPVIEGDLVHANGEREIVRRVLEQGISADVYFVEVGARCERRQSE